MNPNDAFELIRTLGSIASMVSAYWAIRATARVPDEDVKASVFSAEEARREPPDTREIQFVQALPKDIGEAATRRLQRALDRYKKAWDSPMNVLDLDKESELAAWEICNTLRILMKRHGELPMKKWRDLWKQFKCDEVR